MAACRSQSTFYARLPLAVLPKPTLVLPSLTFQDSPAGTPWCCRKVLTHLLIHHVHSQPCVFTHSLNPFLKSPLKIHLLAVALHCLVCRDFPLPKSSKYLLTTLLMQHHGSHTCDLRHTGPLTQRGPDLEGPPARLA